MGELIQFILLMGLAASLILQLFSVFLGFRLVRISRYNRAWVLLSLALLCMAGRRAVTFYHVLAEGMATPSVLYAEGVALLTSLVLVAGLLSVTSVIRKFYSLSAGHLNFPFGELFEKTTSGVAVYRALEKGRNFVVVDINPAAERIEKIAREHVTGRLLTEVSPGVEESGLLDVLRQVMKTGRPESLPLRYYHDDRISGWRDSFVYRSAAGELVVVYNDVSVQMRMTEELERRERKFRILFEQAPLPYQVLDGDGRIQEVNPAWLKLTGLDRKNAAGRPFSELLSRKGRQQFSAVLAELHQQGSVDDVPLEIIRKDGVLLNVVLTALAQKNRTGELEQIYCMLDEQNAVTAAHEAAGMEQQAKRLALEMQAAGRRELQQQRLALFGELTAGLARELNAPLAAARNAFNLMRQDLSPASPHYEFAGIALRELSRLGELVEQMYRFHEPEGQGCEMLNINAMLDNTLVLFKKMINERGIQLKDERDPSVPQILLPPGAVMLTLINPVKNSLEALSLGGTLTLWTGPVATGGVFVEIEDNGPGIPPDFLPRVFEPFTRFRYGGAGGGGPGLGLAQVQHTLNALGGAVEVKSRFGEGTRVRIILPAGLKSHA